MRFHNLAASCGRLATLTAAAALSASLTASGASAQDAASAATIEALKARLAKAEAAARHHEQEAAAANAELKRLKAHAQASGRALTSTPHASAEAAAPAAKAPWQGHYVGAAGGLLAGGDTRAHIGGTRLIGYAVEYGEVPASIGFDRKGSLAGIQAGYNWHLSEHIVVGVEGDYAISTDKGRSTITLPGSISGGRDITSRASAALEGIGTLRGRFGVSAFDRLMIFGTAGLAIGEVETSTHLDPEGRVGSFAGSTSDPKRGWVAGVGLEYALTPNLSTKIEYLHYNLGTARLAAGDVTGAFSAEQALLRFPISGEIVRAGVNLRF